MPGLERAGGLEAREERDRAAQPRQRERHGERVPEPADPLLEPLESPAELALEALTVERGEPVDLGDPRGEVALHELRGLLEGMALPERLPDADRLVHREDVVVVLAVPGRPD